MRSTLLAPALALVLLFVPTASAVGHGVNVEIGTTFSLKVLDNPFGGQGDAVDVGVQNAQCSDEADLVDVGVDNREGETACQPGERCDAEEGQPFLHPLLEGMIGPQPPARAPHCSDDSDTVDIGLLNQEGSRDLYCEHDGCRHPWDGDAYDGVDVGVANAEWGDREDGADVGAWNCEYFEERDALDAGVANVEHYDDHDTFDASLLNTEYGDWPDANGLNVFPGSASNVECLSPVRLPRLV